METRSVLTDGAFIIADETTPNYGWEKPDVAADDGTWGGILNDALDDIDQDLKAVSDETGYKLISSGSASAASTVDIAVPATYRAHRLLLTGVLVGTNGSSIRMRFNMGSGVVSADAYGSMIDAWQCVSAAPSYTGAQGLSYITLGRALSSAFGGTFAVDLSLPQVSDNGSPFINALGAYGGTTNNSGAPERSVVGGFLSGSGTRCTSIRIYPSGGTLSLRYVLLGATGS